MGDHRERLRAALRRDDGSVSLELAIVFPVLLLIVVALLQYGLWFHARTLAQAAAAEGATAARTQGAVLDDGRTRAEAFLAEHAGDLVLDSAVSVTAPSPGHVAVEVRGRSLSLLPLVPGPQIVQSAQGPVERFTTPGEP
ncbi:TadE/TadG family type IV pilus assembly protein [Actinotalea subterranea]|uniref:TadE/TadG family type IV pilus assembly protein n=1 Tax=Actinotalea subterranea TaxID=2607497 RepID=UPI0011EF2087|nr:TadE/TadG family type IV pilus assembly protein [Actinotalea subterranea]